MTPLHMCVGKSCFLTHYRQSTKSNRWFYKKNNKVEIISSNTKVENVPSFNNYTAIASQDSNNRSNGKKKTSLSTLWKSPPCD